MISFQREETKSFENLLFWEQRRQVLRNEELKFFVDIQKLRRNRAQKFVHALRT